MDATAGLGAPDAKDAKLKEKDFYEDAWIKYQMENQDAQYGGGEGGGVNYDPEEESNLEESKGQLRALLTFQNVTKPWVSRSGLEVEISAALSASLLELKDPAALKSLKVSGFAACTDAEYEPVRESMKAAEEFEPPPSGN